MDSLTLIIALLLAYSSDFVCANLLNWPAFGANLAIAFIGSRIVYILKKGNSSNKHNDTETYKE